MEFDKNRTRVKECPCGKSNKDGKFAPYVGYTDKGYCHGCSTTFATGIIWTDDKICVKPEPTRRIQRLLYEEYIESRIYDETCNLQKFLGELFGNEIAMHLQDKYNVGASDHWDNATIFWLFDVNTLIRTGKVIQYEIIADEKSIISKNCKRKKDNYPPVQWVHSLLKLQDYNIKQCFFGEHLLKDTTKPVAIVESEKTAMIASIYLPEFIWIACGGKGNLKPERCKVLQGRMVTLFPDINCYEEWTKLAMELPFPCKVSNLLEQKATEKDKQLKIDIADYLLRFDYKDFIK